MEKRVTLDLNNMQDAEFYRQLLVNIYKAADYLGERAESRSNDWSREDTLNAKDKGHYEAYAHIKQMIVGYDWAGEIDFWEANHIKKELPNILKP